MIRRPRISAAVRRQVTERDEQRCAYCRSPMLVGIPMVVDHVLPLAAGGVSTIENLCLACYRCNEFKGSRTESVDPESGQIVALFHPREQSWHEHFAWSGVGDTILALTPSGRATTEALRLNNTWIVQARRIWMLAGVHPPLTP